MRKNFFEATGQKGKIRDKCDRELQQNFINEKPCRIMWDNQKQTRNKRDKTRKGEE